MNRFVARVFKSFLVIGGIVILTSLSVDATDYLRGSQSALGLLAGKATKASCRDGMVEVEMPDRSYICMDTYEASPSRGCDFKNPARVEETAINIAIKECVPDSIKAALPWTNVAKPQAEQLCARVGKRLPTNAEWYASARGTPDSRATCNTAGGELRRTGRVDGCVSGIGAVDMVGNAWEWVDGMVDQGQVNGTMLPPEGYVAGVDEGGIPRVTTTSPQVVFNRDYLWSDASDSRVMMRGGFYGSRDDAGIYTLQANGVQTFAGAAVGFRCAQSL